MSPLCVLEKLEPPKVGKCLKNQVFLRHTLKEIFAFVNISLYHDIIYLYYKNQGHPSSIGL